MAYGSASRVATYCRNLLGAASAFSASTSPTLDEITAFLSSGCGVIETNLEARGYTMPVATDTSLYDALCDLNSIYAAAQAEMVRTNVILGMGERTRAQVLDKQFWTRLKRLLTINLTPSVDVAYDHVYTGGISVAVRDGYTADTDRIQPRFSRDKF